MDKPKFTPGKWQVVETATDFYVGAPRPGNEARIDDVLCGAEGPANAHLIAAAPELYAALEALLDDFDDTVESTHARAALAKARGEQ